MPCHSSSVEDSLCSSNICDVCYVSACISRRAYKLVSTIKRIGCHIVAQLQKICLISKFNFNLLTRCWIAHWAFRDISLVALIEAQTVNLVVLAHAENAEFFFENL